MKAKFLKPGQRVIVQGHFGDFDAVFLRAIDQGARPKVYAFRSDHLKLDEKDHGFFDMNAWQVNKKVRRA